MNNPLRSLKYLPWLTLFQVAGITVLIAAALDFLLLVSLSVPAIAQTIQLLLTPPLGLLVPIVVCGLIGALGVAVMERLFRRLVITPGLLWALVLCLIVVIVVKSWIIPGFLVNSSQGNLIGLVVGVFLSSTRHWR